MNIPLIDLKAEFFSLEDEIVTEVKRVLASGQYISGSEVLQFEREIALFTNTEFAVSVANGTDALVLALHACGIGPGDEVITSPYTFFASAEAIARVGATPVFADIDEKTYNLSPENTELKITAKTKAIIPVHIFGQPADMDEFLILANKHNLYIIEDACQALGSIYKGKPVGSIGDVGCFSFFPTKNLGGYGDGGIIVTNDEEIANKARLLRAHGSSQKYFNEVIGYNSRLDEIQAAILKIKLKYLNEWNKLRQQKAEFYNDKLKELEVITPYKHSDLTHVYHIYLLQSQNRQKFSDYLNENGIATGHYYPRPLHLQKAFSYLQHKVGDFPIAEKLSERAIALPMFPDLSDKQLEYIVGIIYEFFYK